MNAILNLVSVFVFPGMLFLVTLGMAGQFVDRKLYARLQNRVGPPWYQPVADLFKLLGKEAVVPEEADRRMFTSAPIFALAAVIAAYLYIPLWGVKPVLSFQGDLVVVLYLLLIPTLTFFLGGWYSRSIFSTLGAVRSITQLFAYEIPLLIALFSPALLANTWSISGIAAWYGAHPWLWLVNLLGLAVALVTLLGKLERVPFDAPEAETEIVAGSFTEYSGRYLAFFRLAIDSEAIVSSSLLAAVFLPFGMSLPVWWGALVYLAKVGGILSLLALLRTVFARLRMDQMINFCWRYVAPLAFLQVIIDLVVKEFVWMGTKPRRLGTMFHSVLGSLFMKPATIRYPFEKFVMPKDFRGQPKFISEKCSGCRLCIRDCPSQAITITKVGEKKFQATLDLGRCVYCAQCAETCPRKAVEISTDFELARIDRGTLKIVFPNPTVTATPDATANAQPPAPRAEESAGT